jgi:hypothetical protein
MLVALVALSTPLLAQITETISAPPPARSAIGFGFAATLGPSWQIEAGEIGYVRKFGGGLLGALSIGARIGTFIDEAQIVGGTRGILFAGTLAARTGTVSVAQIGDEMAATNIGFDITVEASGYAGSSSPIPQGSQWLAAAVLPGIRVAGNGNGPRYGIVIGPTIFIGSKAKSDVRGLLALRIEAPLARREPRP